MPSAFGMTAAQIKHHALFACMEGFDFGEVLRFCQDLMEGTKKQRVL
jgi:hypothetical protein